MNGKSCPVSFVKVDGNVARISAFYVGLLFSTYLFTHNAYIVYFLILDFTTRLFLQKEYSLVHLISFKTKQILHIRSVMVDSAAKRLAAYFGLIFLIFIAIISAMNITILFYILSITLLACITLEVLFSYCLGCEIYHIYKKIVI